MEPECAGFSAERLQRVSAMLRGYVDRGELVCASAVVASLEFTGESPPTSDTGAYLPVTFPDAGLTLEIPANWQQLAGDWAWLFDGRGCRAARRCQVGRLATARGGGSRDCSRKARKP
jgi:hypothetical protein